MVNELYSKRTGFLMIRLGWCINGAPAAMLKKRGKRKFYPILNLHEITQIIDEVLENKQR